MFTGIIETTGKIISITTEESNLKIRIGSSLAKDLKIGQSVAHNGVCLTVERVVPIDSSKERRSRSYIVTAVKETLSRTNIGLLKKGSVVNLERSLKIGDRIDGHFVQGHVDCTAAVKSVKKEKGSWTVKFEIKSHPDNYRESKVKNLIIAKGSVCVNGVSLTVVEVKKNVFSVAIIPHTFKHTNFFYVKKSDIVNVEFDVLGKYIQKNISNQTK